MAKQKEKRSFTNFGFSTILLFFVMVCVVIFSVLSFVTAHSDYNLSKKAADKTAAYYSAQVLAAETLTAIDLLLLDGYETAANQTDYFHLLAELLPPYGTFSENADGIWFTFSEPITETQSLSVVLHLLYPENETDVFYEILEWSSNYIETESTIEDEPLHLFQ